MGRDKRRNGGAPAGVIFDYETLRAPMTEHDKMVMRHVFALEFGPVRRWPNEISAARGAAPAQCHRNSLDIELNDPGRSVQAIHGWWRRGEAIVSHSVIMANGTLWCVTPDPAVAPDFTGMIEFAVDPWIERRIVKGRLKLFLFEKELPVRLSLNPAGDAEKAAAMLAEFPALAAIRHKKPKPDAR